MDIKEFAQEFLDNINVAVEMGNTDYDQELASAILEYLEDNGEVNNPEICSFQKTRARITAYDYNDEAESLDLFYLVKADSLLGKVNNSKIQQGFSYLVSFYREAMNGTLFKSVNVEKNDEIVEVAKLVQSTKGAINQLRIYVITDGLTDPSCVPGSVESSEDDFIIEYNVWDMQRVFQQHNIRAGKEKGIRKTLREEPDMFFSYNNGISTTAKDIEIKEEDGGLYITRLYDWQIVNGGQTTASIAASLSDREVEMQKVYVPMKISVIRDVENCDEIVKAISTSANSQTAIKNSDFSANEPYLVDLEKFSRSEWVPNGNNKPYCKWYFERTRGQYLDQLAQLSGYNLKSFKTEYPKNQKITKTDIAKYEASWNMQPYNVCRGAEKNYSMFVADIKRERPMVTANYYKHIIAKGILFDTIDSIVKSKKLGGYKANMNTYLMACVSLLSDKGLDLTYIWENQMVQQEVIDKIEELLPMVWNHLTGTSTTGNQSSNVGEWSKKPECWNRLKLKLGEYEKFGSELMQAETNEDGSYLNEAQQNRIKEAEAIDSNYWFGLANWAKSRDLLSPLERKAAFNFGTMRSRNRAFKTLKQAQFALKIVEKAEELGYQG